MNIWIATSSLPGYLPMDNEPFATHINSQSDAIELARMIAHLIDRDGEASADDSSAEEDEEGVSGDYGMIETMQEGGEGFRDILFNLERAIRDSVDFSYYVHWSNGITMVYFATLVDNPEQRCSDDECDECAS